MEAGAYLGYCLNLSATIAIQEQLCSNYFYRFTPSAGSHTYSFGATASSTTGTPQIGAGAGGGAVQAPAFLRILKV
jgi:hypothetical protein